MVRIFASVFSVLALSSAVLAVPMPGMASEPASEPMPMKQESSTSAAMGYATTTANAYEASTTAMMKESSTAAAYQTTSAAMHEASTTSAEAAKPTSAAPEYGSGSSNWGTDMNSCVQMCQAKFGMSSGAPSPPPTTTTAAGGAAPPAGTGATHTVIVAPTKGVLRYVPFAVNASVGDTVRFMWGAGPHTVTKSSALTVCNKSADASTFASGMQNASFVFDQVVNTTEPTFFYCAVATHCAKGMFGIINPPSAPAGAASSVGMMMSTWTSQNPDIAKMQTAVDAATLNTPAYNWASNLDVANIPTEAHQSLVENVFYTRMFYAANTGADQGAARPDGQPISIPADVSNLLTNTAGNPAGASGSVPAGTPTGTSAAASSTPSTSGANNVVASSAVIAAVAVFSSLFLI